MSLPADLNEDFASLFNFLPIGAYRTAPDGRLLRANPALVAMAGHADEASLLADANRTDQAWYVRLEQRAEFRRLLDRDGFVRGFVSEVRPAGAQQTIWISENAHLVRDADGQVLYYEGTIEDITERIQQQRELHESEQRLRLISDQVPGMVFMVHLSPDGRREYRFVSSGVREIYGFEPEELMRDPGLIERYRHPDDQAALHREIKAAFAESLSLTGEFRIVWPDGQVRWVYRRSGEVRRDATGITRVGVLLDITARKEAENALRESEALWRLALESTGDGVWDWDITTGREYLSDGILKLYGLTRDELGGTIRDLDDLTHPDDLPGTHADHRAHFEGRTPTYRNEHRIRNKEGHWIWVLTRGRVIARDEQGRALRMVGTHTDITAQKEAEAQRQQLEAQLRESQKMEAIGTLAGGVAHDFNNLLAAILGNLTMAREDVGAEHPAQESLAEIHRAAVRARQLVQQILTFSRRQSQSMEVQPLLPSVNEALGLMRALLPAGVQMNTQLSDQALYVMADATQIQQVLMNLCTNAWQSFDGRAGQIDLALQERQLDETEAHRMGLSAGGFAHIRVADNGPGMDEATCRRVFEPFFTTKAPGTGTGLGLAVVHGIVKAHQGAIALHSEKGQGTRFDVYLPLAQAPSEPTLALSVPDLPPPAAPIAARHIVYVDDYEALVFLVGRLLRKQGFRVTTFESAQAALDWFVANPQEPVDLLVTDQNMPGMSGIDLVQALKAHRPSLRMAIVSGHVSEALTTAAEQAGVFQVMGKQDSMDALGQAITDLLSRTEA